ncbi:histidine phosphatase family protein [Microbacterium sp. RD1]|uniref:histidine phosphatase family protein n=1 Tax=Microbacterium sp. RD1 TaxID=3457313 RepID=UPI003FA613EF
MTILTFVRHGETDWNRDGRIQGTTDIPLNDTGRRQSREAAERFAADRDPAVPVLVVSSDLSRAAETADIIAEVLGAAEPTRYRRLRERAYGDAEGLEAAEFARRWGDWSTAVIPGAEAWPDVRTRALSAIADMVRDGRRRYAPVAPWIIAVAHGALIRQVIRFATGGELPRPGERLHNASAHTLLVERDHLRMLAPVAAI